jgi:hypothetical protein
MNVFEIEDLRRYIFSFLRKEPELICKDCNKVLIWDKKVNDFIRYDNINIEHFFFIKNGNYCMNCHTQRFNFRCNIS